MPDTPETLGEVGRMIRNLREDLDRRFNDQDKRFDKIEQQIEHIKERPTESFRVYILPLLTAVVGALIVFYLTAQGVTPRQ